MKIRFTVEELNALTEKARKTGCSREGFCRDVLNGEVRRTGYNINQLLKIAKARGLLDAPLLRKSLEENRAAERMLWQAFQEGR